MPFRQRSASSSVHGAKNASAGTVRTSCVVNAKSRNLRSSSASRIAALGSARSRPVPALEAGVVAAEVDLGREGARQATAFERRRRALGGGCEPHQATRPIEQGGDPRRERLE